MTTQENPKHVIASAARQSEAEEIPFGPPPAVPAGGVEPLDPGLVQWLQENPAVQAMLQEARECGRWLITVHRKIKDSPPDDLAGRAQRHDFPADAVLDTLQGLCHALLIDEQQARQRDAHRCADKSQWK